MSDLNAEVLVAGVGGCGSSAMYHLAKRGIKVIGLDRFDPGHDRGSSHGDTRVIRQAYFEHPDYVPLLRRAYSLWRELEQESQESLMNLCGLLMIGPPNGEIISGSRLAASRYNVPLESVDSIAFSQRFPAFQLPEDSVAEWEPSGGYLQVEECVRAYARLAVANGAQLKVGESIVSFESTASGVSVKTNLATYSADRLILTTGAWSPGLIPEVKAKANLHVLRKVLGWYPRKQNNSPTPQATFFVERPHGAYYGFPCLDGSTVKLAEHTGGLPVKKPLTLDRSLHSNDIVGPSRFIAEVLPGLTPVPSRHDVCMYTMTGDCNFLIDHHPEYDNVVMAGGFSGHGFKFMSAIGEVLAELAVDGKAASEIGFLGLDRFTERLS